MKGAAAIGSALLAFASPAFAQAAQPASACPPGNGVRIYTVAGPPDSASRPTLLAATDTVLKFDFAERKWSRTDFAAMVDVGWAGDDRRRFSVCAGVSIEMPDAT